MPLGAPVACPTRIKRPPAPILSLRILTPPTRQFGLGTCLNYNHIDICNSWRQSGSRIFSSGSRPPEVQRPAGLVASSGLAQVFCEHLFCIFTFLEAILHEFVEAGAGLPGFLFGDKPAFFVFRWRSYAVRRGREYRICAVVRVGAA